MKKFINGHKNQVIITVVLLLLWLFFVKSAPKVFLDSAIYISFLTSSIPFIAIVALGMTLVVVTGEMDLSFAANMAMSGFIFAVVTRVTGHPLAGLVAGLAMGTFIGWVNGQIIVRTGVPAIVATIGTDFFWRGTVMLLSAGLAISLPFMRGMTETSLMVGRVGGLIPAQTIWCLALAGLVTIILHRTVWGDNLRFIGDNRESARMMGIAVSRSRVAVFTFLGFTAALAGVLATAQQATWWPTQGEGYLLLVFASVFLGGTQVYGGKGTVWGTMVGAIIIGMIEAGLVSAGWSGFWTRFLQGLILVALVSFFALASRPKQTENN